LQSNLILATMAPKKSSNMKAMKAKKAMKATKAMAPKKAMKAKKAGNMKTMKAKKAMKAKRKMRCQAHGCNQFASRGWLQGLSSDAWLCQHHAYEERKKVIFISGPIPGLSADFHVCKCQMCMPVDFRW
jgi:hypothetical protein